MSNVQFGMGGAGTFSDGKLTTRVNDPVMADILQAFVKAGAPQEILTEHKPHVGTDKLRAMVQGLAAEIERCGGEIRCETQAVDFLVKDKQLTGLLLNNGTVLPAETVILACGHSARDTYKALASIGVGMEAKAFAIGVRVEHPQPLIDKAQYGDFAGHPRLSVADYALVYHTEDRKRVAYSFCMCPGGQVVAAVMLPPMILGWIHWRVYRFRESMKQWLLRQAVKTIKPLPKAYRAFCRGLSPHYVTHRNT